RERGEVLHRPRLGGVERKREVGADLREHRGGHENDEDPERTHVWPSCSACAANALRCAQPPASSRSRILPNASPNSPAVANRWAGFFSSKRKITASSSRSISGLSSRGEGAGVVAWAINSLSSSR